MILMKILVTISNHMKKRKRKEEKLIASSLAFMMSCTDKMQCLSIGNETVHVISNSRR